MKKLIAICGMSLALVACVSPAPSISDHDKIWNFLQHNAGLRPVDVTILVAIDTGSPIYGLNRNHPMELSQPSTICQSAKTGAAFRAYDATQKTVIGIACIEQDGTIVIPLQKVFG